VVLGRVQGGGVTCKGKRQKEESSREGRKKQRSLFASNVWKRCCGKNRKSRGEKQGSFKKKTGTPTYKSLVES